MKPPNAKAKSTEDLGEPISELAHLVIQPSAGFVDRIQSSIDRRRLGSQMMGLAWYGYILWFLELVAALVGTFAKTQTNEEGDN